MDAALVNSLTERESALMRETEPERLAALDEDALVELHTRVRRARDRQVKIYRRQAAALVPESGARGTAYPKNTRNRAKTEVFEGALARVSQKLAAAARKSAAALRARRDGSRPAPRSRARPATPHDPQRIDNRPNDPSLRKQHASTQAQGARRQARRDAR